MSDLNQKIADAEAKLSQLSMRVDNMTVKDQLDLDQVSKEELLALIDEIQAASLADQQTIEALTKQNNKLKYRCNILVRELEIAEKK